MINAAARRGYRRKPEGKRVTEFGDEAEADAQRLGSPEWTDEAATAETPEIASRR